MTQIFKREFVTIEKSVVVDTVCDLCAASIPKPDTFAVVNFTLEYTEGYSYPDDSSGKGWAVKDLCPNCARRLRDLLQANGFKISELNW